MPRSTCSGGDLMVMAVDILMVRTRGSTNDKLERLIKGDMSVKRSKVKLGACFDQQRIDQLAKGIGSNKNEVWCTHRCAFIHHVAARSVTGQCKPTRPCALSIFVATAVYGEADVWFVPRLSYSDSGTTRPLGLQCSGQVTVSHICTIDNNGSPANSTHPVRPRAAIAHMRHRASPMTQPSTGKTMEDRPEPFDIERASFLGGSKAKRQPALKSYKGRKTFASLTGCILASALVALLLLALDIGKPAFVAL
jgi:hypothetical protein